MKTPFDNWYQEEGLPFEERDIAERAWNAHKELAEREIASRDQQPALRAALYDAAASLRTIADKAGTRIGGGLLVNAEDVRAYANSRANAASEALKKAEEQSQ